MNDFTNHYSSDDDIKVDADINEICPIGSEDILSCSCELPDCNSELYTPRLCMSGHEQRRLIHNA